MSGLARVLFKSPDQERQFVSGKLDSRLVGILYCAAQRAAESLGWTFTITEVWRSLEREKELKGSGVHHAWRAIDIRTRDVPQSWVDEIARWINSTWRYDPLRPWMKVAYAKPHGDGPHIHLQIHPRTRRVG